MKSFLFSLVLVMSSAASARAALLYDLRVRSDGSKAATVQNVNDVVQLDLFAVVTGAAGNSELEGFQYGFGSVLSTTSSDVQGSLAATLVAPFATGASAGAQANLNTDNILDVGSNATASGSSSFLSPRSGRIETAGTHLVPNGQEFLLATVKFTLLSTVATGSTVQLNFRVTDFTNALNSEALWQEDGISRSPTAAGGGALPTVGPAVIISIAAIPEPSSALLLSLGLALAAVRRAPRRAGVRP